MANNNFVVQNGLQVGPLTISATDGSITTTGPIATSGASPRISQNASNVIATANFVNVAVNGANVASFGAGGLNLLSVGLYAGGTTGAAGQVLKSTGTGISWASADQILNGASNVRVTSDWVNVAVNSSNIMSVGSSYVAITDATQATGVSTGALQVAGGMSVAKDVWVSGNIYTANLIATTYGQLTVNDPLLYLTANVTYPYSYDIGFYSQFTGGAGNTYQHTGFVRDNADNQWKLFSNAGEPTANQVDFTSVVWDNLVVGNVLPGISNLATLGSSTSWFSKTWSVSVQAQYADLAENYVADTAYEPGTVLMFGGEKEVTLADAETQRVAGVVSTDPAYLMNAVQTGENIIPLALTGRVPCKVTGTIRKGDMLTSSGNGYAHANPDPKLGAVIGKALQDHDGLEGVIEVVVGRL